MASILQLLQQLMQSGQGPQGASGASGGGMGSMLGGMGGGSSGSGGGAAQGIGGTAGGLVGTGVGAYFGQPQIGGAIGSSAGSTIGSLFGGKGGQGGQAQTPPPGSINPNRMVGQQTPFGSSPISAGQPQGQGGILQLIKMLLGGKRYVGMAGFSDILDQLKQLLGGPPPSQAAVGANGPIQIPGRPMGGGALEAIGIPLALLGAFEGGRTGRGARSLSNLATLGGSLLSDQGNAMSSSQAAYDQLSSRIDLMQQQGALPKGAGIKGQLLGEGPTQSDKDLDKYLEAFLKKTQGGGKPEYKLGPDGKMYAITGTNASTVTGFPQAPAGGKFPTNPLQQQMIANGSMPPPPGTTADQFKAAMKAEDLRAAGNKETADRLAAKYGLAPIYDPGTGETHYGSKLGAAGAVAKPGPKTTVSGGYLHRPVPELGPDAEFLTPMPASTLSGRAMELMGVGPKPVLSFGGKLYKPVTGTTKSGKSVTYYNLPSGPWMP